MEPSYDITQPKNNHSELKVVFGRHFATTLGQYLTFVDRGYFDIFTSETDHKKPNQTGSNQILRKHPYHGIPMGLSWVCNSAGPWDSHWFSV